jgi:glycosyltransferase involved in cell wall biosynthesis
MRVALVHDWLTGMRGGEKCLEALCGLFPDADVFTLVCRRSRLSANLQRMPIKTSVLQRLPRATRWYRHYLPLMPLAVEQFDLEDYDLVISSSHAVAKGVVVQPDALHVCYCHTPMRYAWDASGHFLRESSLPVRVAMIPVLSYFRMWDVSTAARVDHFVANSTFCASRIQRYYDRSATVIHPPVNTEFFSVDRSTRGHYLIVSALVPYKRIDLAIEAFNTTGRPLKIVGAGPLRRRLAAMAGPSVEFTGWVPDTELRELYATCRALLLPSVEDCGITPLEANAAGRPVIALGRGGYRDTVVPLGDRASALGQDGRHLGREPTGVFFEEQTPASLNAAVDEFEKHESVFRADSLRRHAGEFDESVFKARVTEFLREVTRDKRGKSIALARDGRAVGQRP